MTHILVVRVPLKQQWNTGFTFRNSLECGRAAAARPFGVALCVNWFCLLLKWIKYLSELSCLLLSVLQRLKPKKPVPGSEPQGSRSTPSFMKVRPSNGKPKQIPYTFTPAQEVSILKNSSETIQIDVAKYATLR